MKVKSAIVGVARRAVTASVALFMVVAAVPAVHAAQPRNCPEWESGVQIAIRAGNASYTSQYRLQKQRRVPESQARRLGREYAQMAFWRGLRVQTRALVDWSTDPTLFGPMYMFAYARTDADMLKYYREAMTLCKAYTTGDWPTLRLVP